MKKINPVLLFFVLIILLLIFGPLIMPLPPLDGIQPVSELLYDDSQFVDINGVNIHYQEKISETKSKTLILLLHGFGSSTYSWQRIIEPLSKFGTVIAYDRPAFGLTERVTPGVDINYNPYPLSYQPEIINFFIEQNNIEKVILIGNSAGGTVAIQAALDYPEKIDGLILISPAVYGGGGAPKWIKPLLNLPQMDRLGPVLVRTIRERGLELLKMAWANPENIQPQDLENYQKPLSVDGWDVALWEFTKVNGDNNLESRLNEIQIPVVVISGAQDKIIPPDQSEKLSSELLNSEIFILPNCGHVPQEECPIELMEIIDDYLLKMEKQ